MVTLAHFCLVVWFVDGRHNVFPDQISIPLKNWLLLLCLQNVCHVSSMSVEILFGILYPGITSHHKLRHSLCTLFPTGKTLRIFRKHVHYYQTVTIPVLGLSK